MDGVDYDIEKRKKQVKGKRKKKRNGKLKIKDPECSYSN
jgi:hypothetical protein